MCGRYATPESSDLEWEYLFGRNKSASLMIKALDGYSQSFNLTRSQCESRVPVYLHAV